MVLRTIQENEDGEEEFVSSTGYNAWDLQKNSEELDGQEATDSSWVARKGLTMRTT